MWCQELSKLNNDTTVYVMNGMMKSWDAWSLDTCKPCLLGEMTKTLHSSKTEFAMIVVYHALWCIIFQQVVNFIISWTSYVDLDEYVYSLMKHESEIVWYDQRDFRMKTDIKLTRKTSLYDLIKVTNVLS